MYVRNQNYNDCVVNSLNAAYEIEYNIKYGKPFIFKNIKGFSNGYGYTIARQEMKTFPMNTGLFPRNVIKLYNKKGTSPEYFMPYNKYKLDSVPDLKSTFASNFYKIKYYEAVTIDQLPYVLSNNKPVLISMDLDGTFLSYRRGEILDTSDGKLLGGHAMVAVGIKKKYNKIIVKVLNSWGKFLGDGGYWYMTLDYLKTCSHHRTFWCIYV